MQHLVGGGTSGYDRGRMSALSMSTAASAVSTNTELLPGIDAIMEQNEELWEMLDELRDKPYLRLYSIDMLASCEYMPQELFECYSETCEIYPVDEEEVSPWKENLTFLT